MFRRKRVDKLFENLSLLFREETVKLDKLIISLEEYKEKNTPLGKQLEFDFEGKEDEKI